MASSKIQKQYIVDSVTSSATTIEATKPAYITVDATKAGYKPIGIVGISKTIVGTGVVNYITLTAFYVNGNNITTGWHNDSAVDRTIIVTCAVLYEKSS